MVSPVKFFISIILQILIFFLDHPNQPTFIFTLSNVPPVPPPQQPQFSRSSYRPEHHTSATTCILNSSSCIDPLCELTGVLITHDTKETYCRSMEQCYINLSSKLERRYTLLVVLLETLLDCDMIMKNSNENQRPT